MVYRNNDVRNARRRKPFQNQQRGRANQDRQRLNLHPFLRLCIEIGARFFGQMPAKKP